MKLDAANGFSGGAPAAANAQAGLANIGQDNVSTLQAFQGSRLVHFDGRNFNCMGDELICTSADTGTTQWSVKLKGDLEKEGGFLGSPPAAAGGQLFLATLGGEVLQVEPLSGKVIKNYQVGSAIRCQPAIENGRIFVGTQDGQLVCIDTGNVGSVAGAHGAAMPPAPGLLPVGSDAYSVSACPEKPLLLPPRWRPLSWAASLIQLGRGLVADISGCAAFDEYLPHRSSCRCPHRIHWL